MLKMMLSPTFMAIKSRKAKKSWHQKQMQNVAIVVGILAIIAFGVVLYLMNRLGTPH